MAKKDKLINVLIAPLDWGLGHTTRCITVIRQLQKAGCIVYVACEGASKLLLEKEFTTLNYLPLKGYRIQYSRLKRWLPLKILQQLPNILLTIHREHAWLKKAIDSYHIHLVISDNRFGLYTRKTPCIFITHQLQIVAPFNWLEKWIQRINYGYINRFAQCWVPDFEGTLNMAGRLSHPAFLPAIPVQYIGPLSRVERIKDAAKKYDWMIVLSGPEPQRSLLENKLLEIIPFMKGIILLVRGKPGSTENIVSTSQCTVVNHLNTEQLQLAFAESEFIISRSGYTTVMEILSLQKKAILIPTPGQTEQEYLGKHLYDLNWCYCFGQDEKDYVGELEKAKNFAYQLPEFSSVPLEKMIAETVSTL